MLVFLQVAYLVGNELNILDNNHVMLDSGLLASIFYNANILNNIKPTSKPLSLMKNDRIIVAQIISMCKRLKF